MNQKNEISNTEVINLAVDCLQKYSDEMGWNSFAESNNIIETMPY